MRIEMRIVLGITRRRRHARRPMRHVLRMTRRRVLHGGGGRGAVVTTKEVRGTSRRSTGPIGDGDGVRLTVVVRRVELGAFVRLTEPAIAYIVKSCHGRVVWLVMQCRKARRGLDGGCRLHQRIDLGTGVRISGRNNRRWFKIGPRVVFVLAWGRTGSSHRQVRTPWRPVRLTARRCVGPLNIGIRKERRRQTDVLVVEVGTRRRQHRILGRGLRSILWGRSTDIAKRDILNNCGRDQDFLADER